MDIEIVINEIRKLTQIQIIFMLIIFTILLCITVFVVKQTCCKNCIELDKYDNKFKNQTF